MASRRMTNRELKKTFLNFNEDFFSNSLDKDTYVHFGDLTREDCEGMTLLPDNEIIIDRTLAYHPDYACQTLLHEMIHCKLGDEYKGVPPDYDHGLRFKGEIIRLFNAGAYDGFL